MPAGFSLDHSLSNRSFMPAIDGSSSDNAAAASPPASPPPSLDWLRVDTKLEALVEAWSRAESRSLAEPALKGAGSPVALMRRLDKKIARLDRERSALLERVATSPATSPVEALQKLLVASRLLEGEGGAEHAIVSDAARCFRDLI